MTQCMFESVCICISTLQWIQSCHKDVYGFMCACMIFMCGARRARVGLLRYVLLWPSCAGSAKHDSCGTYHLLCVCLSPTFQRRRCTDFSSVCSVYGSGRASRTPRTLRLTRLNPRPAHTRCRGLRESSRLTASRTPILLK